MCVTDEDGGGSDCSVCDAEDELPYFTTLTTPLPRMTDHTPACVMQRTLAFLNGSGLQDWRYIHK